MKPTRREKLPWVVLAGLIVLALAAGPAFAATYTLRAAATTMTLPGNATPIPMWGFALVSYDLGAGLVEVNGAVSVPGPKLAVPAGQGLTVNLVNELPEPVSIIISGQKPPLAAPDAAGPLVTRNAAGRIQSFTHETPAAGTGTYVWNSLEPGTYLYHSGTHPAVQVQMGLYGAITKNAVEATATTPAEVYPGRPYDSEVVLLYSEIDPALHLAVAGAPDGLGGTLPPTYGTPAYPSTLDYQPKYFLVNGVATDAAAAAVTTSETSRLLLRLLNAGLVDHVPQILGPHVSVVAEDGKPHSYPQPRFSLLLPAGKTLDALLAQPAPGTIPIFDRRLFRTNAAEVQGAMHAYITVLPAIPGAPVGAAAPVVSFNQVTITWEPAAGTVDGYLIERTTGAVAAAPVAFAPDAARVAGAETVIFDLPDPKATSYTDTTVQPNTSYSYVIYAYNSTGRSEPAGAVVVTTPVAPPGAPTGLAAAAGETWVSLSWTPASGAVEGYRVERSEDGGATWPAVFDIPDPAATGYSDTTVTPNATYDYRAFAYNVSGDSPSSNVATVTVTVPPPATPTSTRAYIHTHGGGYHVYLRWTDRAKNEQGYYIERSTDRVNWSRIAATPAVVNMGRYEDHTTEPDLTYHYRVQAYRFDGASVSGNSNVASIVTPGSAPQAPSNLQATLVGYTIITLSWQDNSANEQNFILERSRDNFATVEFSAVRPANLTTYEHHGLKRATTYYFRVKAYNASGESVSEVITVRTLGR